MKVLDLFSGIGGFALGLERAGMQTVAFCEIEPYCREVLRRHWPGVPIHEDVRQLDGGQYAGVDVICGGWPCQTYSSAARGRNVHPEMREEFMRIVDGARPRYVVIENVPRIGIDDVCDDLVCLAYGVRVHRLRVPLFGHLRDRVYFVAHAYGNREPQCPLDEEVAGLCADAGCGLPANARALGSHDGVSLGVDGNKRLKALGNAVVPQVVEAIGRAIMRAA